MSIENERIAQLQKEIKEVQNGSMAPGPNYRDKLKELMKLRRSQTRKGKKKDVSTKNTKILY